MTNCADELEAAAGAISPESLQTAKAAVVASCQEYVCLCCQFSQRLQAVDPSQIHKFARAFCLTLLGHLPTRPETCPFCVQYGQDRECRDCGYASTHGRCDADNSAFSLFIESFQELGRLIFQETGTDKCACDPEEARRLLSSSIKESAGLAGDMQVGLAPLSTLQLMGQKQIFIDRMVGRLPLELFSEGVKEQCDLHRERLKGYW
jgi:hypothetical protein